MRWLLRLTFALVFLVGACASSAPDCGQGEEILADLCDDPGLADLIASFCAGADTGDAGTCAAEGWINCVNAAETCGTALECPHATPENYGCW